MKKIVRTLCLFTAHPEFEDIARLAMLASTLVEGGYEVQTQRLCSPDVEGIFRLDSEADGSLYLCLGSLSPETAPRLLPRMLAARNVAFNVDLSEVSITMEHVDLLFTIIANQPGKTFNFTYTFSNRPSSPYFPSATYEKDGFAIGLQPTNLSAGCTSLQAWLERMRSVWEEIDALMSPQGDYLGMDTSIAPLFEGDGSFLDFLARLGLDFGRLVTSDVFLKITGFIKEAGPKKTGLCGLMFPCLEDFELARAYERGAFSIERALFLSLHSGLGIDTYPIGVDEDQGRVMEILKLVQGLSRKYRKPLSVRFVSDGVARIGEMATFGNQYLKDVRIRPI